MQRAGSKAFIAQSTHSATCALGAPLTVVQCYTQRTKMIVQSAGNRAAHPRGGRAARTCSATRSARRAAAKASTAENSACCSAAHPRGDPAAWTCRRAASPAGWSRCWPPRARLPAPPRTPSAPSGARGRSASCGCATAARGRPRAAMLAGARRGTNLTRSPRLRLAREEGASEGCYRRRSLGDCIVHYWRAEGFVRCAGNRPLCR